MSGRRSPRAAKGSKVASVKHVAPSCRCPSSKEATGSRVAPTSRTTAAKTHAAKAEPGGQRFVHGKQLSAIRLASTKAHAARTHVAATKRSTTARTAISADACKCPKDA